MIDNSPQPQSGRSLDFRNLTILLSIFAVSLFLWNTPLLYPVKLFVVLLHEFSHGLAAMLSGGQIHQIQIQQNLGGVCQTLGGSHTLILCAGYLGSMFWGGLILLIASKTKYDHVLSVIIGIGFILIALLYIRQVFGFVFAVSFGILLIAAAKYFSNWLMDLTMKFLGMTSCLYAVIDIKEDLLDRTVAKSDAYVLAQKLGFPSLSIVIGSIWILVAVGFFLYIISMCSVKQKEENLGMENRT